MIHARASRTALFLLLMAPLLTGCSGDESTGIAETVSAPSRPTGLDSVYTGQDAVFWSGGAVNSKGHGLEYRFDGDAAGQHVYSAWSTLPRFDKQWSTAGTYRVRAQARCVIHAAEVSAWSDYLSVAVESTIVSKPNPPAGLSERKIAQIGTYCSGGALCGRLDPLEYRFDFDAAGTRDRTPWGADTCQAYAWSTIGSYEVRAQARSTIDTMMTSPWSDALAVVVRGFDPDTRILGGWCFFVSQSTGLPDSMFVDFSDGKPDTLPNYSRLRMHYEGWDRANPYPPPDPMRFQFAYMRWGFREPEVPLFRWTPWYPLAGPEDTNPMCSDPVARDRDSTTMLVNTFDYRFMVRAGDERKTYCDATPAEVRFVGNFPPVVDSAAVGFYDQVTRQFRRAPADTLYIGWSGEEGQSRGDTMNPYSIESSADTVSKSYRFCIRARGHDDRRERPGSGIFGWRYAIDDPETDYPYERMNYWFFDNPVNTFEREITITIDASMSADIVANPPAYLGRQSLRIVGLDMDDWHESREGIRGITPAFDSEGNPIPGNYWIINTYYYTMCARRDTIVVPLYLKLVR